MAKLARLGGRGLAFDLGANLQHVQLGDDGKVVGVAVCYGGVLRITPRFL